MMTMPNLAAPSFAQTKMAVDEEDAGEEQIVDGLGLYKGKVRIVNCQEPAEETMLLWGLQQPTLSKPNAFSKQSYLQLHLDSCGRSLSILQSPSSLPQ
ncbi:hypothetical protein DM860_001188 [Cuscuta australis]|uniref:Uncharacterized protein n=1 Tax=Cuscuta australis TaxID=267555 RepID=A0A328DWL7_9ASTE|nr:hypothetical protein DM860_001188 [Cuscuta australis]